MTLLSAYPDLENDVDVVNQFRRFHGDDLVISKALMRRWPSTFGMEKVHVIKS
jgi:hypothetical protein